MTERTPLERLEHVLLVLRLRGGATDPLDITLIRRWVIRLKTEPATFDPQAETWAAAAETWLMEYDTK